MYDNALDEILLFESGRFESHGLVNRFDHVHSLVHSMSFLSQIRLNLAHSKVGFATSVYIVKLESEKWANGFWLFDHVQRAK